MNKHGKYIMMQLIFMPRPTNIIGFIVEAFVSEDMEHNPQ